MVLPRPTMLLFMGQSGGATTLLIVTFVLTLAVLHAAFTRRVEISTVLVVVLVYVMVLMRDVVRVGYLKEFFTLEALKVAPQYSRLSCLP